MLLKLKAVFSNESTSNFLHIGLVKFVNIFSKYLLIGFLIRNLGELNYGTLTWVDSFIQYFIVYINFGFDIFIVKEIVENIKSKEKTDKIISTVLTLKLLLFLTSYIILSVFVLIFDFKNYSYLLFLMLFMGLGEVFFPIWYFQGVRKMKYMSLISFVSKGFLIASTFIFIKNPEDLNLYVIILVFSNLFFGFLGLFFLKKISKFKFTKSTTLDLKNYLKIGFLFYLGRTSTLFLNFGTIFLIGKFFSKSLVAGFDLSSKIIFAFVFVFEVIQQAVFPIFVSTLNKNLLKRLFMFTTILSFAFYCFVFYFSNHLLILFGGPEMIKYTFLLKQLSVLIPIIGVITILGSCGLVAFGALHKYNYSFLIAASIYIFLTFSLYFYGYFTFQNLIYVRILVDLIMATIIFYHSIKIHLKYK